MPDETKSANAPSVMREFIEFRDPGGLHLRPASRIVAALKGVFPATVYGVVRDGELVEIGRSGSDVCTSPLHIVELTARLADGCLGSTEGLEFFATGLRAESVLGVIRDFASMPDPGTHTGAVGDGFHRYVDEYQESLLRAWGC